MLIFFFLLSSAPPLHNSFWINSPVFRDNPNSLLFPLHRLDDIPISTYHIQGKLYTQQTFLFSPLFFCLPPSLNFSHSLSFSLSLSVYVYVCVLFLCISLSLSPTYLLVSTQPLGSRL